MAPGGTQTRAWGGLEIREKVGEGAFGEVYRAWDPQLEREVALKLLKKEPSARASLASSVIREGRLLARVSHPNVVTVHGAETHDGRVGLWMEFVRGRSLEEQLERQGKFGAREASLIGIDICRALAAVHLAGLVHRDVKSRNVMRREGGRILLMDFGAGRDLSDAEEATERGVSGTPLYIAPEMFLGQAATARSDIYSLGVLLFHLVTGSYPVQAASLRALRDVHKRREVRLLRDVRPDLPEAFVRVVERALAWDPQERFGTAGETERALSQALGVEGAPVDTTPAPKKRPWLLIASVAAIVVVVLLGAAMLAVLGLRGSPEPASVAREPSPLPPLPGAPVAKPAPGVERMAPATADSSLADADAFDSSAPASSASRLYRVEASLIRVNSQGERERLDQGALLALGDWLSLEFEASEDLYLYVINEDEEGHAFALFPLPDLDLKNPLPAGKRHELPGRVAGETISSRRRR